MVCTRGKPLSARSLALVRIVLKESLQSPRWLASKSRHEEGLAALEKLRVGKMTHEEIVAEYNTLEVAASRYQEKGKFRELFWKSNIRQTFIVIGINFFLQTTGFTFHLVYGSVYIRSLGTINPFNVNLIKSFLGLAIGIATMWASDIVGRRYGAILAKFRLGN